MNLGGEIEKLLERSSEELLESVAEAESGDFQGSDFSEGYCFLGRAVQFQTSEENFIQELSWNIVLRVYRELADHDIRITLERCRTAPVKNLLQSSDSVDKLAVVAWRSVKNRVSSETSIARRLERLPEETRNRLLRSFANDTSASYAYEGVPLSADKVI